MNGHLAARTKGASIGYKSQCVEDFGWVLVIASDPDFDGGYFGFEQCDGTAGFY